MARGGEVSPSPRARGGRARRQGEEAGRGERGERRERREERERGRLMHVGAGAAAARKAGKGRARARTRAAAPPPRRALSPPRPQRRPARPPEPCGKCPTRASARRAAEKRAPAAGRRQPPPPPPPPSAPSSPRSRRRPRGWGAAPRRGRRRAPSRRVCTWCGGRGQQHCEGDTSGHAPRQGGRVTPPAAEGEVADRGDADLEGGERKVCGPARKTAQLLRGVPRRFTEGSPPLCPPARLPSCRLEHPAESRVGEAGPRVHEHPVKEWLQLVLPHVAPAPHSGRAAQGGLQLRRFARHDLHIR